MTLKGPTGSGCLSLIITNDYEVMGDGSGDVQELMIQPTKQILEICEEFDAPHTLFVDMVEFWKFEEAERTGSLGAGFRAASAIREQLRNAVFRGHDVQLHLHPQWIDAKPVAPGSWTVRSEYWRLPLVPGGIGDLDDTRSLRGLFRHARRDMEEMLGSVTPDYRCVAFRAGGYCIQPEAQVLRVMKEEGLRIDSSVTVGRARDDGYARFDFRDAPEYLSHWLIEDSVTTPSDREGLLEIPVFTDFVAGAWLRRFGKFEPPEPGGVAGRIRARMRAAGLYRVAAGLLGNRTNFDFCKLTEVELVRFVEEARVRYATELEAGLNVPLVMTGHSKEWTDGHALRTFLRWASAQKGLRFATFPEWLSLRYPSWSTRRALHADVGDTSGPSSS